MMMTNLNIFTKMWITMPSTKQFLLNATRTSWIQFTIFGQLNSTIHTFQFILTHYTCKVEFALWLFPLYLVFVCSRGWNYFVCPPIHIGYNKLGYMRWILSAIEKIKSILILALLVCNTFCPSITTHKVTEGQVTYCYRWWTKHHLAPDSQMYIVVTEGHVTFGTWKDI